MSDNSLQYQFGPFRFDASRRRLTRDGEIVPLRPKALEVLAVLVQSSGSILEKDDLIQKVWPDTFVEESNLSVHIFTLRKALGQGADTDTYIETIPRVGFRFKAEVERINLNDADLIVERRTRSLVTIKETESIVTDAQIEPIALPAKSIDSKRRVYGRAAFAAAVVIIVAAAGFWFRSKLFDQKSGLQPVRSVAVLPFKSLTSKSDDEYLRIGVADALITKLANLRQIVVRPSSSILKYVNSSQDAQKIGRDLGVEAVLEGHLQRDGERIRATVQLVRVNDGAQIWAGRFDDAFTNIFAVQDSISDQVASSLSLNLTADDKKVLAKQYTGNTDAYRAYLLGRHFLNKRTDESIKQSIDYFKQAIDKDPLYAMAYAGLADAYTVSSYYSAMAPRDAFPKARAAAERSLEIDETLVEARTALAYVKFIYEWDFEGAEKDFQKTFELNPNYATARFWYGECLMYLGRFTEGIAQIKRAQELDPLSLVFSSNIGWAYHIARQDDEAIKQLEKVIAADNNFHMAYFYLGMAYESKGMFEQAIAAYQKAADLSGGYPGLIGLARAYALSGRQSEAFKILARMNADVKQNKPVRPTAFSTIYAGLNDPDKAFEWLEKAYQARYEGVIYIKVQPYYDNLRSDPRYFELIKRIGLTP